MELSTMFKYRLQRGEGVLHHCIEGERVGVDGSKIVDVDHRPDRCPGGTPARPEARRREPPSFFLFLSLPLDGRGVPPLVLGLHGAGGAGAHQLDLPLCSLLFCVPQIWPKTISYILGDPHLRLR